VHVFDPQTYLGLQAQNGPELGPEIIFQVHLGLVSDFSGPISGPKKQANASREKSTE
jgi:hypothetical protein